MNIFSPNNKCERVKFFIELQHLLDDGIDAEIIMGGDFNCTMQSEEDRYNCSGKNDVDQIDIRHLSNLYSLEDIWRRRYPAKREYTWEGGGKMSRIDFWLTSISLNNQVEDVHHTFASYTDHNAVHLTLRTHETARGKGVWKMNTSNLLNAQYKEKISQLWAHWQSKKPLYNDIRTW